MAPIILVWLAVLASGIREQPDPGRQSARVDLIELNHFVDNEGREVFRQLIFYDWSDSQQRFLVRSWRLVKSPEQLPKQTWKPSRYYASWRENGVIRRVESSQLRETWTQQDPEKSNRRWLPEDQRIPLWRAAKAPSRPTH